jgi:hypothetical protein
MSENVDPRAMGYGDWSKYRKALYDKANADHPDSGPGRTAAFAAINKIEDERDKFQREKEKAEKAQRKKDRAEGKNAKEKEKNRVEGLAKALIVEMDPYEKALSQRIYDGEKDEQKRFNDRLGPIKGLAHNGPKDKNGIPAGYDEHRVGGYETFYNFGGEGGKADRVDAYLSTKSQNIDKWWKRDKEAEEDEAKKLSAAGEKVITTGSFSTKAYYVLRTITKNQYDMDTKSWVDKPTVAAIRIEKYNRGGPSDARIKQESDVKAKEVIHSYANKLIQKTEEIAGKDAGLVGTPKIKLSGNDPWRDSEVEIGMGDKKVTWKTKMIWNTVGRGVRSGNSYNQWPTRLKDTSQI